MIEETPMKLVFHGCLLAVLFSANLALAQQAERPAPTVNPTLYPYGVPDYANHGMPADVHAPGAPVGPGCAGCAGGGCPQDFVWAEAEYLVWWVKNGPLTTPLVTTGSVADPVPGALDQPNTTVLFGDHGFDYKTFSGIRVSGGFWANCDHTIGFDGSGFALERRIAGFTTDSDIVGRPLIARPFTNAITMTPDAETVSVPGLFSGRIAIASDSELWGAEANARSCVYRDGNRGYDVFAGFRYIDLGESLEIVDQSLSLPGSTFLFNNTQFQDGGNLLQRADVFTTHNRFYAGQIGGQADYHWGGVFVSVIGKLALGDNHETVTIAGRSSVTPLGGTAASLPSGLLAVASNVGSAERDQFAVVPELRLRVGYQFNHYLSAYMGYTLLYWSDVVRPGNQIDPVVNPTLITTSPLFGQNIGGAQPAPRFERSDFWAQGLDFGLAVTY
jgi:hypothetical protein